jgi:hypothetical protein
LRDVRSVNQRGINGSEKRCARFGDSKTKMGLPSQKWGSGKGALFTIAIAAGLRDLPRAPHAAATDGDTSRLKCATRHRRSAEPRRNGGRYGPEKRTNSFFFAQLDRGFCRSCLGGKSEVRNPKFEGVEEVEAVVGRGSWQFSIHIERCQLYKTKRLVNCSYRL